MKIIYVCPMNLSSGGSLGIKKKILSQVETFRKYSFDTDLVYSTSDEVVFNTKCSTQRVAKNSVKKKKTQASIFNEIFFKIIKDIDYDAAYIRLDYASLPFLRLLKYLKKKNVKIILEIPTFPYHMEIKERANRIFKKQKLLSIKLRVSLIEDYFISKKLKHYVDRVVTYSKDEKIFEIETIKISNGINTRLVSKGTSLNSEEDRLNLIAVSTLNKWHGYDRLIKGLAQYYQKEQTFKVYLSIVGDGEEREYYKELIKNNKIENYIHLHGMLTSDRLDHEYNNADLAIDSLGRHRVGVHYNSSIKGKEYLAKGIPIVSGVSTELDLGKKPDFYYRIPANEEPVSISNIVLFYKKLMDNYESKEIMSSVIRQYAKDSFDFTITMLPIKKYIEEL